MKSETLVSDIHGKNYCQILNENITKGNYSIVLNKKKYSPGTYLITLTLNNVIVAKKIIIIE